MTKRPTTVPRPPALDQILPGVIVAATFLAFAGTLGFDFVNDDRLQVLQNPYILSWHYLPRYFTSSVWSFRPGIVSNYYRPLFFVWLRLNDAMFGLQPAGWHLTSVLLHLLVTLEVYWAGVRLLRDRRAAAIASALFGLHPIHTESVAWVSAVPDLLVAAFLLASFLGYLHFRDGGPRRWLWLVSSLTLYALATLNKEVALILPMVVFAYEWIWSREQEPVHPRQEWLARFRMSLLTAIPYLAVSAVYFVLRIRALHAFSVKMAEVSIRTIILTWPSLLWFYIQKLVWPSGLSSFYDIPYVREPGLRSFFIPSSMIVIIVGLLWLWAWRVGKTGELPQRLQESRSVAFSAVWAGVPFLTLLNLAAFQSGEIAKDRYLYIPSIGAAWLAAVGWRHLAEAKGRFAGNKLSGCLVLVVCLVLGVLTMRQSAYWSNDLLLYTRACTIAPRNAMALGNMAITAYKQGYPLAALKLYKRASEADPSFEPVYYDMAVTELDLGRIEDSDRDLTYALRLFPADPRALFALGKVREREGRLNDAASLIRDALRLNPDAHGYHLALGAILENAGDLGGALREFSSELALDPGSQEVRLAVLRAKKLIAGPAAAPDHAATAGQ